MKVHTPSLPSPRMPPNSATVRSSSFCRAPFRSFSVSVVVGRAEIHFCKTVQRFGVDIPGVIVLIVFSGMLGFKGDMDSGSLIFGSCTDASEIMGRRACHSPK